MIACPGWLWVGLLAMVPGSVQDELDSGRVRVLLHPEVIAFGEEYRLVIERDWPNDWTAGPWDVRTLGELSLELEDHQRLSPGKRTGERWTYRGRAWVLNELVIPVVREIMGDAKGIEHVVSSTELRALVVPGVDHETPGPPELPREPFEPPIDLRPWIVVAVALVIGGVLTERWRRRRAPLDEVQEPPAEGPREHLRQIEQRFEDEPDAHRLIDELFHWLRETTAASLELATPGSSTEQFLALTKASPDFPADRQRRLEDLLRYADRVRFGHAPCSVEEARERLEDARRLLTELLPAASSEELPP